MTEVQRLIASMEREIIGKRPQIELALAALFVRGHILIEDVPGVGKTAFMRSFAQLFELPARRIQFTADLLPSDLLGVSIYHPAEQRFQFTKGPLHSPLILADELNRASAKTQAALLESMEERQVSIDGTTYALPYPFFVVATQNPIEYEGTYRLPEAQLDRFMFRFSLGYLSAQQEVELLQRGTLPAAQPAVATVEDIRTAQAAVERVHVAIELQQLIVALGEASRQDAAVALGLSPRALLALQQAARAYAYIQGRDYVLPDDILYLFPYVATHRLVLERQALLQGVTATQLVSTWVTEQQRAGTYDIR